MAVKSYKELVVWQKSIDLVQGVYQITSKLPHSEGFGLISQMQRAAIAIPSNIAEGFGRGHSKEFKHFLSIAYGSSLELETQLIITKRQFRNANNALVESLLVEIQKMLRVLISKIN